MKRKLEIEGSEADEDPEAKRRRVLEETRAIDADSDEAEDDDSSEDDRWGFYPAILSSQADIHSDEEDETAELQRELEKIKRERAEKREQEASPLLPDLIHKS